MVVGSMTSTCNQAAPISRQKDGRVEGKRPKLLLVREGHSLSALVKKIT